MPAARVLIVNDDPWTQRMVSAVLVHAGHTVEIASDGWEGLLLAGRIRPDVVISNSELPTTDGKSFVETLRSKPEHARTPAIFLTEGPPPRDHHPELDSFLSRKFRVEELEGLVDEVVCRVYGITPSPQPVKPPRPTPTSRQAAEAEPPRRLVLVGELDAFQLSSVLIVLEIERKTGVLRITHAGQTGRIELREGRVIRARLDGSPNRGAMVVYELLTWERGRFEFGAGEVQGDDEIGSSTQYLLLEGARLADERNHIKRRN